MDAITLRADCTRCAALCCVALAFDCSELFGFDKPAGEPCRHLSGEGRCRIHAERDARGFGGCIAYDCLGAGQYVTQELFGGRSWRDDPALLRPMLDAFAAVREVHELVSILREAAALPLTVRHRRKLKDIEQGLGQAVEAYADRPRLTARLEDARRFLASLRTIVAGRRAGAA